MAVKIRLTRVGKTGAPSYRIVAIDEQKKRDGACLEVIGTYDPKHGTFPQFHQERFEHWISQGAQPTDAVKKLKKLYTSKNPTSAPSVVAEKEESKPRRTATKKAAKSADSAE